MLITTGLLMLRRNLMADGREKRWRESASVTWMLCPIVKGQTSDSSYKSGSQDGSVGGIIHNRIKQYRSFKYFNSNKKYHIRLPFKSLSRLRSQLYIRFDTSLLFCKVKIFTKLDEQTWTSWYAFTNGF